jgi:hypothetical protein
MALEYSELMAGAAMFFKNVDLLKAVKTKQSLRDFLAECEKKSGPTNIQIPDQRAAWLKSLKPWKTGSPYKTEDAQLSDLVRGISAAIAIKKWVNKEWKERADVTAEQIFLTGNTWPAEVNKFKITYRGWDSYNSSDLIVRLGPKKYYGVSLKKKSKKNEASPTLINKAFDTILEGGEFDKVKKELDLKKEEYFAELVKKAHKQNIIQIDNINSLSNSELFSGKSRDTLRFERAYINTKGGEVNNYEDKFPGGRSKAIRGDGGMRSFVNEELSKPNSKLWESFTKVLNDNSDLFADTLIDITLKTSLTKALEDVKDYRFGFALVTGVGKVRTTKNKVDISLDTGDAYDIHTMLCGLSNLSGNRSKYEVSLDKTLTETSDGAKAFFNLSKRGVNILELQLRYKGTFTAQPQFLGVMSDEYKDIMTKECLVKR